MVNVNLTTHTKVIFTFSKEAIIRFSLFGVVGGGGEGCGDDQSGGKRVGGRINDYFKSSKSTLGAVINWDHQGMNVNLTTFQWSNLLFERKQ